MLGACGDHAWPFVPASSPSGHSSEEAPIPADIPAIRPISLPQRSSAPSHAKKEGGGAGEGCCHIPVKGAVEALRGWAGLNDGYIAALLNKCGAEECGWGERGGAGGGGADVYRGGVSRSGCVCEGGGAGSGSGGVVELIRRVGGAYVSLLSSLGQRLRDEDHPAAAPILRRALELDPQHVPSLSNYASLLDSRYACACMRLHASACVSLRQHASACFSMLVCVCLHASACVRMRQQAASAYASISQHASASSLCKYASVLDNRYAYADSKRVMDCVSGARNAHVC